MRLLERALLTPGEAARVLGIGRSKVYELILVGSLESLKIGSCRRVPADAIDALIATLRHNASWLKPPALGAIESVAPSLRESLGTTTNEGPTRRTRAMPSTRITTTARADPS